MWRSINSIEKRWVKSKMHNPKISIITVSYNAAKTIEQTILSVVNQTYSNIEYIIIDGGSADGTIDIIKKYQGKIAYWVSEKDNGIYDAMNKGIDVATGRYLIFIHGGDCLRENILEKMSIYFASDICNFVYGNVLMKDINMVYDGKFNKYRLSISNICQQSIFYHHKIFNLVGKHDLKYNVLADRVLNIKCFADNRIEKVYVNEIIADYAGGGFSSRNIDKKFETDREMIIKNEFGYKILLAFLIRKKFVSFLESLHIKVFVKKILKFLQQKCR